MVPVAHTNFPRQKGSSYLRGRGHLFLSKELCPENHNVVISNEHKTCDKTAKLGCISSVEMNIYGCVVHMHGFQHPLKFCHYPTVYMYCQRTHGSIMREC